MVVWVIKFPKTHLILYTSLKNLTPHIITMLDSDMAEKNKVKHVEYYGNMGYQVSQNPSNFVSLP